MQQDLLSSRSRARVHAAERAAGADDDEREEEEVERAGAEHELPGAWMGRLVQQLSGIWGESRISSEARANHN